MLLLRSVRSRLLLDHRAIAHSLQRCSKYEKIIVERLGRSENGNFITRKHMFHFTLTLIFDRPFSLVSRFCEIIQTPTVFDFARKPESKSK